MARASPRAVSAVVVVVGARLNGHASLGTGIGTTRSEHCARRDVSTPVMAMTSMLSRLMAGMTARSSSVSPL